MTTKLSEAVYFIIEASNPSRMLLYDLPDTDGDEDWLSGCRFKTPPSEPVIVEIRKGYERADLLPYFGTPPVISNAFHQVLLDAGVDNLDVYDAVLRSEDGSVEYSGFKAFNVIGLVSASDLSKTSFSSDNPSRFIDASIDSLSIDNNKARGALFFRLAEYVGAVIVHEKVKRIIEAKALPHVIFYEPNEYIS